GVVGQRVDAGAAVEHQGGPGGHAGAGDGDVIALGGAAPEGVDRGRHPRGRGRDGDLVGEVVGVDRQAGQAGRRRRGVQDDRLIAGARVDRDVGLVGEVDQLEGAGAAVVDLRRREAADDRPVYDVDRVAAGRGGEGEVAGRDGVVDRQDVGEGDDRR